MGTASAVVRGAHLLLQVRTGVLNEAWRSTLRRWYPGMQETCDAKAAQPPVFPGLLKRNNRTIFGETACKRLVSGRGPDFSNMKAIILCEYGSPDRFQEIDLPITPPKSDEVLVQIKAGSINPIDYKIRAGRIEVPLPVVLGHDCAGVIASVGHDVRRFKEGDEVWVYLGGPAVTAPTPSIRR